jgi:hypothetical protein
LLRFSLTASEDLFFMEITSKPEISSDWNMPEFPFVSTRLLLGASFNSRNGCCGGFGKPKPGLLGTVYRDDNLKYGMVIIDITDLDFIRYVIVGFTARTMIWDEGREWDPEGPDGDRVPTLENDRPRRPLAASAYIGKFGYDTSQEVSELDRLPLIDASAMDCKSFPSISPLAVNIKRGAGFFLLQNLSQVGRCK